MPAPFERLLVANRGEIAIRVFRSAHELGIRTVGIYSYEDRYALHRFKADEAYQVGRPGEPLRSYLDAEAIIDLAKRLRVEAIHPGYGFLSENAQFARLCQQAGIVFVGPRPEILEQLGDKVIARRIAAQAGVPVLSGTAESITRVEQAAQAAERLGYPVILKAAHGGGGRGMRVIHEPGQLADAFEQAQRESLTAFGSPELFIEKFVEQARHIEVQLLGDRHGKLVHLYERDCSIQRRHQKVVEIAPALKLAPDLRQAICEAALAIGRSVNFDNAGTVEFLVDAQTGKFYFIEVNPRIQVEHTVTEEVTGVDIVRSQILIAAGLPLDAPEIGLGSQAEIRTHGYAIQCRVTTEDPTRNFLPDYGRISHYRSAGGMGVRLDAGTAFSGAVVHPFYDSLLVKVTTWGREFADAARRMERCLQEFRIRGVKTNIPFLLRLVTHPQFLEGGCTTRFIDQTPELFQIPPRRDRATKLLTYLAEVIVNGNPLVKDAPRAERRAPAPLPEFDRDAAPPAGMRQRLRQLGPVKFAQWVRDQQRLLLTDTTFRDAHQSLLATRIRTYDMLRIAPVYARCLPELFSLEMWGGATFDTAMRFLHECPWQRLADLRQEIPNILFQMLLRASNAVGYTNYPDNVVREFVREAASAGIDLFRIFDALNWIPNLEVAMEAVLEAGALCEAAICYTGDVMNPNRPKYDLKYYLRLARELEKRGAHFLAIKDMAGLCKPYAAQQLVHALKQEVGIPIHFHTHDTAGIQAASILKAAEAGVDVADAAMASLSGGTSQPNLNTLVEALRFTPRDTGLSADALDAVSEYWQAVRQFYRPFESDIIPATSDLYRHEMPGGQYTNLYQQAKALGLADRWPEVCRMYAAVNQMLGDIVKVTPTSKAVGDMALFMVANQLTPEDVLRGDRELSFPESVIDLLSGKMGQVEGGFPEEVVRRVVGDRPVIQGRPGASLPPADLDAAAEKVTAILGRRAERREVVSYLLYPRVFEQFARHQQRYSDTSVLPTPAFFYGLNPGEEIAVDIEPGKTLIIKFLTVGDVHPDGQRTVFFELNGQPREVTIQDRSHQPEVAPHQKADPDDPRQIGAPMPGMVVSVAVKVDDSVRRGQKLLTLEAMKMQTAVNAETDGRVAEILVKPGDHVSTGDLLVRLET
ncbi:MAG: pyruvate carboxylase [Pirellulaceae bacterium]|nr:MAG: pyruvate carboxylase [Pirellulaceae bacterium]